MGTATAPLAGTGRRGRFHALRAIAKQLFTPCVGGKPGSKERKAFWRFAAIIPISNLAGAIDVFLFLWYIAPLPEVPNKAHVQHVNTVAFAITIAITFTLCSLASRAISQPIADWLDSDEPADEDMVRRVLRNPAQQALLSLVSWLASAIAFGILDGLYKPELGIAVAGAIAIGGITTCGMMFLFTEKALHPITVRALRSGAPRKPALPGVDVRMLGTFGAMTAGPLVGLGALAALVLLDPSGVTTRQLAVSVMLMAVIAIVGGLLGVKLVARSLALPLRSMRTALARVEAGDLSTDVRVDDGSEVGVLQAGFNSMVAGLREREQLRDLFGRHVGEHVASSALERGTELGGELRQAAVMFVDVIGSTSLAAERAPDDVVCLLNRFFGFVVEVAQQHQGWVNKFEGDGALCVFGAPADLDDPAGCALSAARELNRRLRAELPELEAGIGVSAGTVVAGNIGHADRYEYTVIGDPVNEASRLVALAKDTPGRVLASAATLARAKDTERTRWNPDGQAQLRGRPRPTKLVIPA